MHARIHSDGIARTGLDAKAAVDAAKRVDFVAEGILFNRIIRILSRLNIDAFGRAGGGAEKTCRALNRPVLFQSKPMACPKCLWIGKSFIRVLNGDRGFEMLGHPKHMKRVDRQISPEVPARDHQAAQDLREIEPFPETHLFESFHAKKSTTCFTYKGIAPFVKERMGFEGPSCLLASASRRWEVFAARLGQHRNSPKKQKTGSDIDAAFPRLRRDFHHLRADLRSSQEGPRLRMGLSIMSHRSEGTAEEGEGTETKRSHRDWTF